MGRIVCKMKVLILLLISVAFGWQNIAHFLGETTIGGKYMIKESALQANYGGVTADNFGATVVELPGTDKHPLVRDMQYGVGDGVGYTPIPVVDQAGGSDEMDKFLRKEMGLSADEQIWSTIVYLHPEEHTGNMKQLATEYVKTESGQTHLGMYIGNGQTRNSPEGYHSKEWQITSGTRGYPATVQICSLKGVPQALFNRQSMVVTALLNDGVVFPSDYKKDIFRTINLKRALAFFKDWLKGESYLRSDDTWKTYCAEHVTNILYVAVNLPQNLNSYKEVYGATEGEELWKIARANFKRIAGDAALEKVWGEGIDFEPLWKRRGVTNPASETGFGVGLPWKAQTNSDLMINFLENYASYPVVGAHVAVAAGFGFREKLVDRMSNNEADAAKIGEHFDQFFGKAAVLMMVAEGLSIRGIVPQSYYTTRKVHLYAALGGDVAAVQSGAVAQDPRWALCTKIMDGVKPFYQKIETTDLTVAQAYTWFRGQVAPLKEEARVLAVKRSMSTDFENMGYAKVVEFNSPPAVTHRIAIGQHKSDPDFTIREVCTAVHGPHVRQKTPTEMAKWRAQQHRPAVRGRGRCAEGSTELRCMSYRQMQLECMERELSPCNVRKAAMMRKLAAA